MTKDYAAPVTRENNAEAGIGREPSRIDVHAQPSGRGRDNTPTGRMIALHWRMERAGLKSNPDGSPRRYLTPAPAHDGGSRPKAGHVHPVNLPRSRFLK